MNRWQGWARQLRRQHGRREARHARGAMVLLQRGGGMPSQVLVTAWRPIVQVHARFGVVRPVNMPALPAMRERRQVFVHGPGVSPHRQLDPAASRPMAAAEREQPPAYAAPRFASPVFAQAHHRHASAQFPQASIAPIFDPARQSHAASVVAAQAAELVTRLHRRAARQELSPPSKPAVLVAAHRMPAPAAAAPANAWMPAPMSPVQWEEGRAPSPAAAVNVEALTGLVIQQIDRRLIAYRERMGRA
ncbi:hypothetical protein LJR084_003675 [Variovorax sp. LjRoot84]|uniref:hypothetical protein n=1 Tax=Variovorax sp. LjRoot84 TaxID=3342340 RepID=UPI003ECF8003